jgi:hypothetical protein
LYSLAITISDIVREVLIQPNGGLPLGMISAAANFSQLSYFVSSRFWYGVRGLSRYRQTWFIATWLILSGIVVTLSGPLTAVLALPSRQVAWPAGAARFNVVGNESTVFPTRLDLDNDSGGGFLCLQPSLDLLEIPPSTYLGCPWSGYTTLMSTFAQWGSDYAVYPINPVQFIEWVQLREINQTIRAGSYAPENWVIGTQPAVNVWSGSLHLSWKSAIAAAPALSPGGRFKYGWDMTTHIPTRLPTVRTLCHYQNVSQSVTNWSVSHTFRRCLRSN